MPPARQRSRSANSPGRAPRAARAHRRSGFASPAKAVVDSETSAARRSAAPCRQSLVRAPFTIGISNGEEHFVSDSRLTPHVKLRAILTYGRRVLDATGVPNGTQP